MDRWQRDHLRNLANGDKAMRSLERQRRRRSWWGFRTTELSDVIAAAFFLCAIALAVWMSLR